MSETSSERPIATDEAAAAGITEDPAPNVRPEREVTEPELPLEKPAAGAPPEAKEPAAEPEPEKPAKGGREPWYVQRLKKQSEQLAQREAELAALRAGQQQSGTPDPAAVAAHAQMLRDRERFNEACNRTFEAGAKEFGPEFVAARDTLTTALGEEIRQRPDFLESITDMPGGHRVYHALAADLDMAAEILALPSNKAALRLKELEQQLTAKPAPARTSKVAAPISPVSGTASPPEDLYDPGLSMADFDRIMRKQEREKRGLR